MAVWVVCGGIGLTFTLATFYLGFIVGRTQAINEIERVANGE